MKKALSIVLSLMLLFAVVPVGTISAGAVEDNVIEIRTIAELYNINNNMSGNYKLMNDIDMTDDVAVGGDWDFMGNGWEPIGSNGIYSNTAFTGTFDGDGHKIIGMRISCNTTPSGAVTIYLGLFANNSGTIKNLGIESTSVVKNGYYSGGICAYNSGTISNCYNKAAITSSIYNSYSGGICAYNSGDISNCSNEVNVSAGYYSGGICGYYFSSDINHCYNTGAISSTRYSGGICGYFSGSDIISCYNTGTISAKNTATTYVGGICGETEGIGKIDNCYNRGSLIANSAASRSISVQNKSLKVESYAYCGGICGDSSKDIRNCFNTGTVSSSASANAENTYSDTLYYYPSTYQTIPEAYSYTYTGGICGNTNGKIINCYNVANASSSVQATSRYYKLVPLTTGIHARDGYYVYGSLNSGDTFTKKVIGGITGESTGAIQSCYNIGTATYGILGKEKGNITNCYYLDSAGKSNAGARALSSSQLQLEMCMTDFDFENTWVLDKVNDYKYPQLISNRQELETTPESVEVTLPNKTSYIVGEEFDSSGMVIMGHYDNDITQRIRNYTISGFTGDLGKNNITVTVGEKSAVFYVTVHDEGEWTTVKQPTCTEKGEKKLYCIDCGELIKSEEIPAKGHTEVVDKGHEATCTESGLTDGSHCSVCDTILTEQEIIPAKGHTPYQNWETIKNPTCISHGEKVRHCSVCGEVVETANIDVTDHQLIIDESKAATCLTSGLTEGSHCSVCNTVIVPQQVIQPKGHQWDEGEIIKHPTCITSGEKIYHCKNCEQTKSETISALGHDYSNEFTIDKEATCTENGSKSRHCTRCEARTDEFVIDKHGHEWDNGTYTKQPTCITTGEKIYHCKNCEESRTETVSALGHYYSNQFTVDKAATCTQDGIKSRHCTRCEARTDEFVIDKHGHEWDNGTVFRLPTCIASGEKIYHCKNCDITKTETVSALGHNFSNEYTVDKAATCTQNGVKSRHCIECDAVTDETVIEKLGHDWYDGIYTKYPTCITEGEKTYYCKYCSQAKTEIIPALGHNIAYDYTIDKAPTCTEDGSQSRHCLRCDAHFDEVVIEKRGYHDWDNGRITKQPTCITEGIRTYQCKDCIQTKTGIIPALGHNFSYQYTFDKAATCTEDGSQSRHCTRCGAHTDEVVIEKHGHHTELVSNHVATYFAAGYTGDDICYECDTVITKGKAIAKLKLATPKVKITAGKQKLTVKYTKVKDATGFQVKYTYKGKTKTKTYTSKKSVTKIIKKLKKGTYKVSVRALIKSKGKTAYSNWTKAKKVKVK